VEATAAAPRILIVEDDEDIARITCTNLEHGGYRTQPAYNCAQAMRLIEEETFDLMLLDMMLPDGDGRQLCTRIRKKHPCPVIFISCLDDTTTIVEALQRGGDDYVVKPVNYEVLLARIKAHLRREEDHRVKNGELAHKVLGFNSFELDTVRRLVRAGGMEYELSVIEYDLLYYMVNNPDTLLLYDELYSAVWVNDSLGDVRTVMVHISNLRKKVDPHKRGVIHTVRGAGYVFSNI
jgi:DNA-binding response OmpR family regulator